MRAAFRPPTTARQPADTRAYTGHMAGWWAKISLHSSGGRKNGYFNFSGQGGWEPAREESADAAAATAAAAGAAVDKSDEAAFGAYMQLLSMPTLQYTP